MTRNRSKSSPKSAAELVAELQKDPDYVARSKQREQQQKANVENYSRIAAPILDELGSKGYRINTIGDLVRSGGDYRIAIPTLLHWLPRITDLQVKDDLEHRAHRY